MTDEVTWKPSACVSIQKYSKCFHMKLSRQALKCQASKTEHDQRQTMNEKNESFFEAFGSFLRTCALPAPLLAWSLIWPPLVVGIDIIAIPLFIVFYSIFYWVAFPIAFIYAAFWNRPEEIQSYTKDWQSKCSYIMAFSGSIKIVKVYSEIFAWADDPRNDSLESWIFTGNIIAIFLAVCIIFETFRLLMILAAKIVVVVVVFLCIIISVQ